MEARVVTAPDRIAQAVAALKRIDIEGIVSDPNLPYAEVLRAPHEHLGPFDQLPSVLQRWLQRFSREEEEIRTLARGGLSTRLLLVGALLSRGIYAGEQLASRVHARGSNGTRPYTGRMRAFLRRTARQSTHVPFVARRWLHRVGASLRVRAGNRELGNVLRAQGFDDRRLAFQYLRGMAELAGCASVSLRPQSSVTHAQLLGFDFVQSGGRYWFLEANCNPVLMDARLALYSPGADPWVNNMLSCVRAHGARRLVVYGYRPFRHHHGRALAAEGRRLGIDVEIFDDVFFHRHPGHRRAWLMHTDLVDAFVVRAKTFDVLFDRAILSKQQTRTIVEGADVDWAKIGAGVPALLMPGQEVPDYRPDARYPNIVGKRDDLDRGTGISFYKLPRVPEPTDSDYFEEYRVPDPCTFRVVQGQRIPLSDYTPRAWKIRSYALLTPGGVEYLSSIKVISGAPVPEHLPDGKVTRKSIYLATINEGGVYSAALPEEDEAYRRVVTAVGEALLGWLRAKHAPSVP